MSLNVNPQTYEIFSRECNSILGVRPRDAKQLRKLWETSKVNERLQTPRKRGPLSLQIRIAFGAPNTSNCGFVAVYRTWILPNKIEFLRICATGSFATLRLFSGCRTQLHFVTPIFLSITSCGYSVDAITSVTLPIVRHADDCDTFTRSPVTRWNVASP